MVQWLLSPILPRSTVVVVAPGSSQGELDDLLGRLEFYVPGSVERSRVVATLTWKTALSQTPVLVFGEAQWLTDRAKDFRPGTFDIDYRSNPVDGWAWCELATYCGSRARNRDALGRLRLRVAELRRERTRARAYVFGTGRSLADARERNWSDGYRIVCNTIVRDAALWNHVDPDFFVAGDAIYHFGHTSFARAFRRDLHDRLHETDTTFVYPEVFDVIVRREFDDLRDRLVPVPTGRHRRVHVDLTRRFRLPALGNVLPRLLLPVACTLSRDVRLWGFDGRAPGDQLFWGNSPKHSYPELLPGLQRAHPQFFEYFAGPGSEGAYVHRYHGEELDACLRSAEQLGWTFVMLHPSWTPTLQKRYRQGEDEKSGLEGSAR